MNKGWYTSEELKGKTYVERYGEQRAFEILQKKKKIYASKSYKKKMIKAQNTIRKQRKGKRLEEIYGETKAEIIKEKIKAARYKQKCPRAGKKHSELAKRNMSIARKKYLKNNPEVVTKHAEYMKDRWKLLPKKDKELIRKRASQRFLGTKRWGAHSICADIEYWYSEEVVRCESSYEYLYYTQLNKNKVFWKQNNKKLVPYINPKTNETHWYIPDFLVYTDKQLLSIEAIGEVKPYEFAYNPKNRKSIYYKITKAKLKALKQYCLDNGFNFLLITELNIKNSTIININIPMYESKDNKKHYKEELLRTKKSILCKC